MKLIFFTIIVSGLVLLGSSSSFAFMVDEYSQKEKLPCGLKGSIENRIRDCSKQGSSRRSHFILVTRTKDLKEVYKDWTNTGILWGDRLPSQMNHYDAEKACNASLAEVGKISEVTWRLPSKKEYEEAHIKGITVVLPNMDSVFWSSSVNRNYLSTAFLFDGRYGSAHSGDRNDKYTVRCVAQ